MVEMLQTLLEDGKFINSAKKETGQGMVEYALVLPIFLLLVFFIIETSIIMYYKIDFNFALKDAVESIEFTDSQLNDLRAELYPYGPGMPSRFLDYNDPYSKKRTKDYKLYERFGDQPSLEAYIKNKMVEKSLSLDKDNISFLDFRQGQESKISVASGLQFYHYKKEKEETGNQPPIPNTSEDRDYIENAMFTTIVISEIKAQYTIKPIGFIYSSLKPEGITHEKVIYNTSKNLRWKPYMYDSNGPSELEGYKPNGAGGSGDPSQNKLNKDGDYGY